MHIPCIGGNYGCGGGQRYGHSINDDEIYGHSVWVDHGNGYVTIYRNKGDTTVNVGDSVVQGTTLFVIGEDNADLGYQMQKDGSYINPMDMLAISG